MNGKEFAKWMDDAGVDLASAAAHFGVSHQTIYNWRSTSGVPASREEWVRTRMHDFLANRQISNLPNRVILEPSREQFRAWGKSALAAGKLIDDWAAETLDNVAAEDEAQATGSGEAPNPLQSVPRAAEDGGLYGPPKKAAG